MKRCFLCFGVGVLIVVLCGKVSTENLHVTIQVCRDIPFEFMPLALFALARIPFSGNSRSPYVSKAFMGVFKKCI